MNDEEREKRKEALEAEIPHFLEVASDPNWIFLKKNK